MRVEVFGLQRFACSDSDILFYTGVPTYHLEVHIEPLFSERPESTSEYIRGRHRALQPVDESLYAFDSLFWRRTYQGFI